MASTYTMVGYGSQGESVRRLQSELNKQGYQLDEDGVFGEKTRAAVRDYQKKNSLKRDGIAGDETWGSLMSASASAAEEPQASVPKAAPTARTAKALAELEAGYKPSESVKEALAHRDSVASQRPGDYESLYEQQLAQLYEELSGLRHFPTIPRRTAAFSSIRSCTLSGAAPPWRTPWVRRRRLPAGTAPAMPRARGSRRTADTCRS